MPRALPTIAATSTLAMVRTAEARGVKASDLLEEAGITRAMLEDPDARLPAPTILRVWNALRARTDPVLQLAAPATLPFGAYRLIDYLVAASGTVGEGVLRFARFFHLIAEALTLRVVEEPDERALCLTTVNGDPVPPVYVDYVFAALVSRIRMRIRPQLRVHRVELRQPEPEFAAAYRDAFRAPVHFGAAADRLVFSTAEWKAPTASGDAALVALLEEHARILAQQAPREITGFLGEAQQALAATLPEGGSVAQVAHALNCSVRTLQRKLVASGTTFRELTDSVRSQLAESYLSDPKVSISEVAALLGFSEQSAFNRAFRRWTGEAPGRWRRRTA